MRNILLVLIVLSAGFSSSAFAGRLLFGDQESIRKIEDIDYKDQSGKEYYLGYKTTMKMFLAGLYLTDDGYVLGIKSEQGSFIPLNEEKILTFQKLGYLPKPLPKYQISLVNYALGYSLWILIIFSIGYGWMKSKLNKNKSTVA